MALPSSSKHKLIYDILHSGELSSSQMEKAAGFIICNIMRISCNIETFGSAQAPPNKGGRTRSISPVIGYTESPLRRSICQKNAQPISL